MYIDVDQKAVNLTYFFFKTPSYRRTTAWLLVTSFIFGLIARLNSGKIESITETFLYGGADGILILALPAIVSALLATLFVSRKQFKQGFKYFSFIALLSTALYATMLLFGLLLIGKNLLPTVHISTFAVIANALVLVLWLAATWIALAYKKKALFLCVLHPLSNLAFLVLWNKFASIESNITLGSPIFAVFELAIASIILLVAGAALVFVINAPTKRNFGISTIDVVTMFFAQWVSGNKGLETILAETGEVVTTQVGVLKFKQGKETKATFLVPQVHYGPIGNLGGSEFPGLLSTWLKQGTNAPGFVFKGTANHDFNPVYSSDLKIVQDACKTAVKQADKQQFTHASFLEGRKGYSHVFGMAIGKTAFLTLSRHPQNTDDIDQALGRALRNKVLASGFQEAILVDRHNCKMDGNLFGPGSKEYMDYEKAIEEMAEYTGKLHIGVAESKHSFTVEEGIGKGGLKTAVFQIGHRKACFIVVDANNCTPEFRETVLKKVNKKYDFHFADLLTTDSHAVNNISGIHNPLGGTVKQEVFMREVDSTIHTALHNLTPCSAGAGAADMQIEVLGPQRSNELVITVNSIFAVLKILAPLIFISSIALAFLALILIK